VRPPRISRAAIALAVLTLSACATCHQDRPHGGDQVEPALPSPRVLPRVHLTAADGREHAVVVEVVRTEAEVQRGLMYRRHLAPDHGMLFLMPEERVHTFWMKNTYLPLDMIFIGRDLSVVGIVEDVPPQTLDLRYVDAPSRYVLEVNAGWSRQHGVAAGARVRFENVRGVPEADDLR
jgi:uncharacterized protein